MLFNGRTTTTATAVPPNQPAKAPAKEAAPPPKKHAKPASAAVAGGGDDSDGDVSLSDDDDDDGDVENEKDEFTRFAVKHLSKDTRQRDGRVAVPAQSSVFMAGLEQHRKQQEAKLAQEAARTQHMQAAVPSRAVSSIGRLQQPTKVAASAPVPLNARGTAGASTTQGNAILRASAPKQPPLQSGGLRLVRGVLIDTARLLANSRSLSVPAGAASSSAFASFAAAAPVKPLDSDATERMILGRDPSVVRSKVRVPSHTPCRPSFNSLIGPPPFSR